jgi:2',3'-cyclic-nucleotide 2'-phosphodiesterase (5'-nucleotidase family)
MMTARFRLWPVLLLILISVPWAGAENVQLTLLHTNDIHAHISPEDGRGGLATLCQYMKDVRGSEDNVLILDAGDQITGTPVSTIFSGTPVFEICNQIPFDALVLGNHEFDHGWRMIDDYCRISRHPLLSANIRHPDGQLISGQAFLKKEFGGLEVLIIGITTSALPQLVEPRDWEGLRIQDPASVIRDFIVSQCDGDELLIVLSHQGLNGDISLAEEIPEIDLIVGGHSHSIVEQPVKAGNALVVQAGSYTRYIGRLDLEVDTVTGTISEAEGQLISTEAAHLGFDPLTAALVEKWEQRVSNLVDVPIGHNSSYKDTRQLRDIVSEILRVHYKTGFGHHNLGGTRAPLEKGVILKRDIWNILPFDNNIYILSLSGEELKNLNLSPSGDDSKRYYTVATNSYVGEHLVLRLSLPENRVKQVPDDMRQIVLDYVERTGKMEMPR